MCTDSLPSIKAASVVSNIMKIAGTVIITKQLISLSCLLQLLHDAPVCRVAPFISFCLYYLTDVNLPIVAFFLIY